MEILVLVSLLGAVTCYPTGSGKVAAKSAQSAEHPSNQDHQLSASTYTEEDFYDALSDDDYSGAEESGEDDGDGSAAYSNEKSRNHQDQPQWDGPLALPPGYDQNGSPHPVQDLPEVVAERQKHLHLYSYGPHAGAVAAGVQTGHLKSVPGGFSTPWVPIIVPLANHYQHVPQQYHVPQQVPLHYT